ncbi:hypothetical protein RJT34_09199 [Clitoria ternatea]|uniref:Uncharacterized protein n=1 Tax=Clitoria ternatea TaxID=43366 RepID=A0AAN9PUH8_CLITE
MYKLANNINTFFPTSVTKISPETHFTLLSFSLAPFLCNRTERKRTKERNQKNPNFMLEKTSIQVRIALNLLRLESF